MKMLKYIIYYIAIKDEDVEMQNNVVQLLGIQETQSGMLSMFGFCSEKII